MDIWNKKKVAELEREISDLKRDNREHRENEKGLQEEINRLRAVIKGDRVCDGYCERCSHGIRMKHGRIGPWGETIILKYQCELNCMCKDFERKDS